MYPGLVLENQERSPSNCIALLGTLTSIEGQANFRAIFETKNHSAYFTDFYPQPKLGETVEAIALLSNATFGEGWSKPDAKGKLEPEDIRSLRIGCNPEGEKVAFALKNVRWIKGSIP